MRVAIIEDEALIAFDMMVMVERLGGEVVATASTEAEAIAIAETARPDVVLMDLRLADGDGARAAERIRANSATAVVFVTGAADRDTQRRLSRISAAPVVVKPFRTRDLCAAVLTAATARFADGTHRTGSEG
jgi:DNA-binding NarL/FixJ family response regulator